jgi:hypothetical protein
VPEVQLACPPHVQVLQIPAHSASARVPSARQTGRKDLLWTATCHTLQICFAAANAQDDGHGGVHASQCRRRLCERTSASAAGEVPGGRRGPGRGAQRPRGMFYFCLLLLYNKKNAVRRALSYFNKSLPPPAVSPYAQELESRRPIRATER